jgi:LPXTG-site transpeptidase (sortase) family protein
MTRRVLAVLLVAIGSAAIVLATLALLVPERLQQGYYGSVSALSILEPRLEEEAGRATPPPSGTPIGVLEIPRLGISSVVLEGDNRAELILGVGHLPDTPMPWLAGNSVLAAHRDTFFRPLARVRRNDVIRFTSSDERLEYVVQETKIVEPTAVEVLAPTSSATLTLITCYPFNYLGPAPWRFVVKAARVL